MYFDDILREHPLHPPELKVIFIELYGVKIVEKGYRTPIRILGVIWEGAIRVKGGVKSLFGLPRLFFVGL